MVRVTTWLCRVPVIKFKKGGLGLPAVPPAAASAAAKPGSCPAFAPSAEEIETRSHKKEPKMLGMIKIPKGVLVTGKRGAEAINLNIVLQKQESGGMKRR